MPKAIFPGSFDPPTYGHLDIIARSSKLFSEIHVVIATNSEKKYLFSQDERFAFLTDLVSSYENVYVHVWDSLVVNFAKKIDAQVLLRGIRNFTDFSYEFDLSILNRQLNASVETVFIPTDPKYFVLKSSAIKELARFDANISAMVPPLIEKALKEKLANAANN
ncbi:MAG: pantetheine-phosphate adenylyltransferase [Treponemataceae bacterium]